VGKVKERYSIANLKHGIEQAEKNIETFEGAINKERETIGQFKWMIEQAERKNDEREKVAMAEENKNGD
jgi:hypothetical protein